MTTTARNRTTGIGSLPHHNVDAALEYSFKMGIPFLPQIPIRNPWEYMIAQALEGLPGLQVEPDGSVVLNLDVWTNRAAWLHRQLGEAFERSARERSAFEAFEPSPAVSSSWQPFVWELGERGLKTAKIQITGPMTAQWALRAKDGSSLEREPELSSQIYRLVLARALSMIRRLQDLGIEPIIYLDEPGLYGFTLANPRHVMGLQELKIMIQTLRKEGARVGLHCCSNTDWEAVRGLGVGILSIDTALSLESLLERSPGMSRYLAEGGILSLGVIPTGKSSLFHLLRGALKVEDIYANIVETIRAASPAIRPEDVLGNAIFTPACGLALHTVADAELVLELLQEFQAYCDSRLGKSAP